MKTEFGRIKKYLRIFGFAISNFAAQGEKVIS